MAFHDIAGNTRIQTILRLALGRGRVPNSLLFAGPDGVGKRRTALVLAKALNCERRTDDSCDTCDSCRAVDARGADGRGRHPDILEIEAESATLKVEQLRTLKSLAYLKPMTGRRRVFLLVGAESMNDEAANTLLKVLEEPPPFTHIILLTSNPALLLPTIRSRCQTLAFAPISTEDIEAALRGRGWEGERARLAALVVRGNLEQALELDWEDVVRKREEAWALFRGLLSGEGASSFLQRFTFGRKNATKEEFAETLELFGGFGRDLVLLGTGADRRHLLNPDFEGPLRDLAAGLGPQRALAAAAAVDGALNDLDRNVNAGLLAGALGVRLTG